MCAVKTEARTSGWPRRYGAALRKHLAPGSQASLQPAFRLGRQAVALGLETLDLARIHEQALTTLVMSGRSSRTRERMIERAMSFFAEAIVPIERTHPAALKADVRFQQLAQTLRQRSVESSASKRHLERGVARRRAAEAALKKSGQHRLKLLQKSRRLQERLREQTRTMLSAQEDERKKSSRQLQDEIAQTLLAINVRLLTLKNAGRAKTETLRKEIAETQRLVRQSVLTIRRLGHEYGACHES